MIRKNSLLLTAALFVTASLAGAQQTTPLTPIQKQLSRIDFGISAAGLFNGTVSGTVDPKGGNINPADTTLSDQQSNTVGALVNIRYVRSSYVGFEYNYLYSRYTENFSYPPPTPFGVQTQADEQTIGYLVTPPVDIYGMRPYASVGVGVNEFKPTRGGGQSLSTQARMAYYYSLGLQKDLLSNFGMRVGFRQSFYLAPDYGQNYLTILQHTSSYEPTVGFYVRF